MNRKFAARNNHRQFYLLRGLLVCGQCGRTLAGRTSGSATTYYCTNQGKNRMPDVAVHHCVVAGQDVEPLVWQAVTALLRQPELLADAWQHEQQAEPPAPDELERLQARQRTLDRQWTRLLDAFQDGLVDKTELNQRKTRLEAERTALAQRVRNLTRHQRRDQAQTQMLSDFATFCQQIQAALANPTSELQQEVIRLLIDHIVVEEEAIIIKHIIPTTDDCRLLPGRRFTRIFRIFSFF
jgi:site-specific DNA recombinase